MPSYVTDKKETHNRALLQSIAQKGLFPADDKTRVLSFDPLSERRARVCYFYVSAPV